MPFFYQDLVFFNTYRNLYFIFMENLSGFGLDGPLTAKFAPGEVKAFVCMGQKDNEDIKDASRDTDNLWDLEQFEAAFSVAGIDTITATHPGGHEMPDGKMQGTRELFKKLYELYWKGEVNTSQHPPKPTGLGTGLSRNQQMAAIEVA